MRFLYLLLRAIVFIVLLGFAVKNDGPVTVNAYFGQTWQLPLVLVMFLMFTIGLLCGIAVLAGRMFAQNKELQRLRALQSSYSRSSTPRPLAPGDAAD